MKIKINRFCYILFGLLVLHTTVWSKGSMSLNFPSISVSDLLPLIAEAAHKNIIADDPMLERISLNLNNVSWNEAFVTILKAAHLSSREKDNVIYVSHSKRIEEKNLHNNSGQMAQEFIKLNYVKASEIADLLSKNGFLSSSGGIIAEVRTNSLWVKDQPSRLQTLKEYLKKIDVSIPQVLIESRIVYADKNFIRELGVKFGSRDTFLDDHQKDRSNVSSTYHNEDKISLVVAKLKAGVLLDAELSALESEGRGRIISSPKLITLNRESAYIEAGDEVPYQEKTSGGGTNIAFKKAVLGLKVTPEVVQHQKINLHLELHQDKVSVININGQPSIQTRQIETKISADNGQTIVLGGIYEESFNRVAQKIPFLSAIPIMGKFFQTKHTQEDRKELLIFVTPFVLH